MATIKVDDVSFEYRKNEKVLNEISLGIEEGTMTVLLGLNGCGKTTLIKLMAGLLSPTQGSVTLNGIPMGEYSDEGRSRLIAYVSQSAASGVDLTAEEFLLLSMSNTKGVFDRPSREDRERVRSFAEEISMGNLMNSKISELSGGQRQLVAISAALLQDSDVILLDEPTAALDMKNQHLVLSFLKKQWREGKTVVFSCHDPNHALRLGGNTVAIHGGRVLFQGESREIVTPENLKEIYGDSVMYARDSDFKTITLGVF